MAIVTTYVCDITGKSGTEIKDFIEVTVSSKDSTRNSWDCQYFTKKLVHYDVALKLGIVSNRNNRKEEVPAPTFESQLTTLLKDYIDDLLTENERKEIAREAFKEACIVKFKDESEVKRIISNSSYDIVYNLVDKQFDLKLETILKDKVHEIVTNLTTFNIFKRPDAWSQETNCGYQILNRAINDNKELIYNIVKDNIPDNVVKSIKEDLKYYIQEAVNNYYDKTEVD